MTEYLVVVSAFIGAFFIVENTDCEGYDNCIDQLKTVMHDKYEGFSHSITAVHQYGDFQGEGFESNWGDGTSSSDGGGSTGSSGELPEETGLSRSDQLVSLDGSTTYGTLLGGEYVVDSDGEIIGTYDGDTGTITLDSGDQYDVLVSTVITDEDGNPADLQAVVHCFTGQVYGFGYESGATGDFHNSLTLEVMDIDGFCQAPSYGVVDADGNSVSGAIVNDDYYASTLTSEISETPLTASGEVVYFDIEVPNDSIYDDSTPGIGERVEECAVMVSSWDADDSQEELDVYLNSDPTLLVGELDPNAGIPCPAIKQVTD
jgi:hypothetical protein